MQCKTTQMTTGNQTLMHHLVLKEQLVIAVDRAMVVPMHDKCEVGRVNGVDKWMIHRDEAMKAVKNADKVFQANFCHSQTLIVNNEKSERQCSAALNCESALGRKRAKGARSGSKSASGERDRGINKSTGMWET